MLFLPLDHIVNLYVMQKHSVGSLGGMFHPKYDSIVLVMHSGKTESILFTSKRKKYLQKDFIINCAGQRINSSEGLNILVLKLIEQYQKIK